MFITNCFVVIARHAAVQATIISVVVSVIAWAIVVLLDAGLEVQRNVILET